MSLMSTLPMEERQFKHRSSKGTVFTSDRCDLKNGVDVTIHNYTSKENAMADFAEFSAFHALVIREELHGGFGGYDTITYRIKQL